MSKYFLVPDVHGELDMVTGLLTQEGLLDDEWSVRLELPDDPVTVVQMGDFLNGVATSVGDDSRCLDHEKLFDVLLVGNHEFPYFGGPAFGGFWNDQVLNHRVKLLDSMGKYKVALDCDGVLVTHAGVATDMYKKYPDLVTSQDWEKYLNTLWSRPEYKTTDELLCAIGWDRGGWGREGGVLWADWKQYKTSRLKQVVGHSVGKSVRVQSEGKQYDLHDLSELYSINSHRKGWEAVCLDLGAGKHSDVIVGAWVEDGNVRLVEYRKES